MSNTFPPISSHSREIQAVLATLASVITDRNATYISAPITSGKRFAEWQKQVKAGLLTSHQDYTKELICKVIEPNREHAKSIIRKLRGILKEVLIDPTAVADINDWNQDDYRHLWASVIECFANKVIFINGWQFSNGCAYEFFVARRCGISTLNESLLPIGIEEGARLVQDAITEVEACSLPTDFLGHVYKELCNLYRQESICAS